MKVIIIKDCKDGKVDQTIDVADGYAKNFLIKKGFAVAVNKSTLHKQSVNLETKKIDKQETLDNAMKVKAVIENISLGFKLKQTNMVIHGSITRKQIHNELIKHGIKVDTHAIESKRIASIGLSNIMIKLHKDVSAKLRVEVTEDGK